MAVFFCILNLVAGPPDFSSTQVVPKFGPRAKVLVPPMRQLVGRGAEGTKRFGPWAKDLVPPKRQLGGRGADGTRTLVKMLLIFI